MDGVEINILKWLKGNCPHKGCLHNDKDGICECNDNWFLSDILNIIREEYEVKGYINENITISCNQINVKDGYCPYCGSKLIELHIPELYGIGAVYRTEVTCSNPNCY